MASLGSRLIFNSKSGVEAAETVRINATREGSSLNEIVNASNDIMKKAYSFLAMWLNVDPSNITAEFNDDFMSSKLSPQELTSLAQALLDGAISPKAYVDNLNEGEMFAEGHDLKEEVEYVTENQTTDLDLNE